MRQCHAELVYNSETFCKSDLVWLRTGCLTLNCHWEHFPQSGIGLLLSPTHRPAQPSCPATFCPLLSRVNRAEIAQLPTRPTPQNELDVTAAGGQNSLLCDFSLFALDRSTGLEGDWPQRLHRSTETDWAALEQNRCNGPKLCKHTSAPLPASVQAGEVIWKYTLTQMH